VVLRDFPEDQQRYVLNNVVGQEQRVRRRVLPLVCAALPDLLQREALAAVRQFDATDERLRTLVALAPVLPESLQHEVVAAIGKLEDPDAAGKALGQLCTHLAEPVLSEALAVANDLGDTLGKANALAALAPRLARAGKGDDAMKVVGRIDWELNDTDPVDYGTNFWAQALTATARWLPASDAPTVEQELLDAARSIPRGWVRAQVLAALSPFLEASLRDAVIQAELDKLSTISPDGEERTKILKALAPQVPERLLPAATSAACGIADSIYVSVSPRADALAALAPRLAGLPPPSLYGQWHDILHVLSDHPRGDLLWDLAALSPIPIALAGTGAAAAENICALGRVARWWP
jgi:hypothetical protein